MGLVEKLESLHESKSLDLLTAKEMFEKMHDDYPDEFAAYELPHVAVTVVAPLLKQELRNWQVSVTTHLMLTKVSMKGPSTSGIRCPFQAQRRIRRLERPSPASRFKPG